MKAFKALSILSLTLISLQAKPVLADSFSIVPEKAGDAMAAAGFMVSISGLLGIMDSTKAIDQFYYPTRRAMIEAIEKDASVSIYKMMAESVQSKENELAKLTLEFETTGDKKIESDIRQLRKYLDAAKANTRVQAEGLFKLIGRYQNFTSKQLGQMIEGRQKSLQALDRRIARVYGRSTPYMLVALGGAVIAVIGTNFESLNEMTVDEAFTRMNDEGKDFLIDILNRELRAAEVASANPSLDDLMQ